MNPLFKLASSVLRTTFAPFMTGVSELTGPRGQAVKGVSDHFIGIGTILTEGNVSNEYAEIALAKCYEAKTALDQAIVHGWNGGKTNSGY